MHPSDPFSAAITTDSYDQKLLSPHTLQSPHIHRRTPAATQPNINKIVWPNRYVPPPFANLGNVTERFGRQTGGGVIEEDKLSSV
jgi:hypothetical protein